MNELSHILATRGPVAPRETDRRPGKDLFFGPRETDQERQDRLRRGDDAPGMVLADYSRMSPAPTAEAVRAARAELAKAEADLRPLDGDALTNAIANFLGPLNFGVANPQDDKSLALREMALRVAAVDLPRCVWSEAALREALSRFKFFPAVAEIVDLLGGHAAGLRAHAARLRKIACAQPRREEGPAPAPTEAEKAAVAAAMAKVRAQQGARDAGDRRVREFGLYMPGKDVSLRGPALIAALKADLPKMSADLREVTERRIAMLEAAQEMAAKLTAGAGDSA